MITEIQNVACHFLEELKMKVIYGTQDDIFIVTPINKEEKEKYGTAVFSPRFMEDLGEILNKF